MANDKNRSYELIHTKMLIIVLRLSLMFTLFAGLQIFFLDVENLAATKFLLKTVEVTLYVVVHGRTMVVPIRSGTTS